MAIGYEKFKTPFFEIFVGGPEDSPKNMTKLPYQILKLVDKIEILRTFDSCLINDVINITFVEGSREPYSQLGQTADIYKEDQNKLGLDNKPGLLPDLLFGKGGVGIRSLDSVVNKAQDMMQEVSSAASLLPLDGLKFTGNIEIDRPKESIDLKYIFQEGNRIRVDWGYVEEKAIGKFKSVIGKLMMLKVDFPENGMPTTTIMANGPEDRLDRISTPLGVRFSKKLPAGVDTATGKLLLRDEDLTTKEVLQKICNDAGMKLIISDSLDGDKLNKDNVKKWIAGESLYQFFNRLAHRHNCYYTSYIDPNDGKTVLAFIKRSEFESISNFEDSNLFTYRANGSIIKSISFRSEFSKITGVAKVGVTREGKIEASISEGGTEVVLFQGQKLTPQNPGSLDATSKKLSKSTTRGGTSIGKVESHPEIDSKTSTKTVLNADANCSSKQIFLDFSTLGFVDLEPGKTINFKGLGNRLSGRYHIQTVMHVLEPNSYTCTGSAYGYGLNGGVGVTPNELVPGQTQKDTYRYQQLIEKAPKSLSDAATSLTTQGSAKDKYDKTR